MEENNVNCKRRGIRNSSHGDLHNSTLYESDLETSEILNSSMKSLPIMSQQFDSEEMNTQLQKINEQLESANAEVANLLAENFSLKESIDKLNTTIKLYKKIGISDNLLNNITSPAAKKIRKYFTSKNTSIADKSEDRNAIDKTTQTLFNSHDVKNISKGLKKNKKLQKKIRRQENKIKNLNTKLKKVKQDRKKLTTLAHKRVQKVENAIKELSPNTTFNLEESQYESHDDTVDTNGIAPTVIMTPDSPTLLSPKENVVKKIQFDENKNSETTVREKNKNENENLDNRESYIRKTGANNQLRNKIEEDRKKPNISQNKMVNNQKKRVIIIADQQGREIRGTLQELLGSQYTVKCYWYPNARLKDILDSNENEIKNLTEKDYVILIGGSNDTDPFSLQSSLLVWLHSVVNTNVIVCETPHNLHLKEKKLNYEVKLICSKFKHVTYVNLEYSTFIPARKYFAQYISRHMLRELLRLNYQSNLEAYNKNNVPYIRSTVSPLCNKSTQTEVQQAENVETNDAENIKTRDSVNDIENLNTNLTTKNVPAESYKTKANVNLNNNGNIYVTAPNVSTANVKTKDTENNIDCENINTNVPISTADKPTTVVSTVDDKFFRD